MPMPSIGIPKVAVDTAKAATGASGGILSSVLGGISNFTNPVSAVISSISPILSLFKTSATGKQKQVATKSQELLSQNIASIKQQALSGALDPTEAIASIEQLVQAASVGASNEYDKRGLSTAAQEGAAAIAQLQAMSNANMNKAYTPGESALTGGTATQSARGSSLMRNMLLGTDSGKAFGSGTAAGGLLTPGSNPADLYKTNLSTSQASRTPSTLKADTAGIGDTLKELLKRQLPPSTGGIKL